MNRFLLPLSFVLMVFVSFTPSAFAANATFFGPIIAPECNCESVTSPNTGQQVPSAPDWGCVLQTVQNSINFAISLGCIIAVIYIVWSGILFVTSAGNPSSREAAKRRIMNVVVGLLVVLAAWLIIDFIMKKLYNESGEFGPWNAILADNGKPHCIQVSKTPDKLPGVIPGTVPGPGGVGTVPNDPGVVSAGEMTHQQAVAALTAAGVAVKPGASLNGTREDTVNQVIALKNASGCPITVTSGTDGSHASGAESHANGYKVDLRLDNCLNAYIQGMTAGGTRSNGDPRYYDRCGNEYVRENDHWDVTVNKGVCSPPKR